MTHPGPATIAILLGDRHGIGPEVAVRAVADLVDRGLPYRLVLVGARETLEAGIAATGRRLEPKPLGEEWTNLREAQRGLFWLQTQSVADEGVALGVVSAAAGSEVLNHLRDLSSSVNDGLVDGVVFAPFNKASLRASGLAGGDTIDFLAGEWGAVDTLREMSVARGLWTTRVTSHVPLSRVAELITHDAVLKTVEVTHDWLKRFGMADPRIALSALNPHAGDGGAIGREEIDILTPVVVETASRSMTVSGPFPADTIFLAAAKGDYDAVVAMYHDQSQLALKLLDFGAGASLLVGLPVPVTTPMHGTAFPIVGKGIADARAMVEAIDLCARVASTPRHSPSSSSV